MEEIKKKINTLLDEIKAGTKTVKWNGWFFSGGRDWGDWHRFNIFHDDELISSINLGNSCGNNFITLGMGEIEDEDLVTKADKIIMEALVRDDKEMLDENGNVVLPEDYCDISREEFLSQKERMNIPVTNIQFTNISGMEDETQFDTQDEHELAELWWEFCKEEGLIEVIKGMADYETGDMKGD